MPDGRSAVATRVGSALRDAARSDRALTLAGALVVAVILLTTIVLPHLDERRRITLEVPQPPPLFSVSLVELPPGHQGCADQIGLLPGRQVAQIRVGTFGKPASQLEMTLLAPGYRESVVVPATYRDNDLVEVPFTGPPKLLQGSVCIANRGHVKVALYASADRTQSRSTTLVDGKPYPANFDLAFYGARKESLLDHTQAILERMRIFHSHLGIGLLWILAILFALGVPLASVAALVADSSGAPSRQAGEREPRAPS